MPFELALVRAGYGAFLRRQGRRGAAAEHLAAAAEGFARLGARPFLEQCERELTASGVGSGGGQADRRSGDSALTPQESTVARLVPATGPRSLKGRLVGVARTACAEPELFSTGEAWNAS